MSEQVPAKRCWLHPQVELRSSPIEGQGLFTRELIDAGTVIARLGGELITRRQLDHLIEAANRDPQTPYVDSISVSEGIDLLMEPGQEIHFVNHSCDPNLWHTDAFTLEARHHIEPGEELTFDYATQTDNPEFSMSCRCASRFCRGTVSGSDWRLPILVERYGNHWVPILLERIRDGVTSSHGRLS